jgi:phospholipase C
MRSTGVGILEFGLGLGGASGAVFGPLYALFSLLTVEAVDVRTKPNQGTLNSFINALIILLVAGLSLGVACGILARFSLDLDWPEGLKYGLLAGTLVGLVSGLIGGGIYAIRNVVLRLIFSISGCFPFRYGSFLDYAVRKLLLHKVGAGYIFVHRTLLQYLADRKLEKPQSGSTAVVPTVVGYRKLASIGILGGSVLAALVAFPLHRRNSGPLLSHNAAEQTLEGTIEKTRVGVGQTYDGASSGVALDSRIGLEKTKHIIVVMLESSSFDRTLGALKSVDSRVDGLSGNETNPDGAGNNIRVSPNATWQGLAEPNPPSKFAATFSQINDAPSEAPNPSKMQGFVKACQKSGRSTDLCQDVMHYFSKDRIPVLVTLALEYATCDHWFSSLPGPSAPNHTFADYGTSFGEVGSNISFVFTEPQYPSIYERLLKNGKTAKIYQYGPRNFYPALFLLSKTEPALSATLEQFFSDARRNKLPSYSFVEPDYSDHSHDADQGADRRLSSDEALVAGVYDAIHGNRELWDSSILLIVFASHGGFYDHVPPPETMPDGFVAQPRDTGIDHGFFFDRLGVRVPAIVVSSYIPRGTVDHRTYEHSSIPATVAQAFLSQHENAAHQIRESEPQSPRERNAKTFLDLLQLPYPRPQEDTVSFETTR